MTAFLVLGIWRGGNRMKSPVIKHCVLLGIIGFLLLSSSVQAAGLSIGGQWEAKLAGLLDSDPVEFQGRSTLSLDIKHQAGPAALDVTLRADTNMEGNDKIHLDLDTAYIDYMARDYDLRFGKQRISWGTAMGLNPTDVINPIDIADPLNDKQPVWAMKGQYYTGNHLELTGVYLPFFNPAIDVIPAMPHVPVSSPEDEGEWALKIGAMGLAGVDLSVMYFSGWERLPTPRMTTGGMEGYYRATDIIGADFATSIGDVGLWLEAAHSTPQGGNSYTNWAVGGDYRLANGLLAAGQYYRQETGTSAHNYLMLGLEKELAVIHHWKIGAVYDIDSNSFMVNPEVALSLADATELVLGGRYLERQKGGLSMLPSADREIYAQVTMSF